MVLMIHIKLLKCWINNETQGKVCIYFIRNCFDVDDKSTSDQFDFELIFLVAAVSRDAKRGQKSSALYQSDPYLIRIFWILI